MGSVVDDEDKKNQMLNKLMELELLLEWDSSVQTRKSEDQQLLLAPMIKDACNYLRTLVHMTAEEDEIVDNFNENEFLPPP